MTPPLPSQRRKSRGLSRFPLAGRQRGVILIISLVMLIVVSLLALSSMHNAVSSEAVAGNARTTVLASQAAEIVLRHCEASVLKIKTRANGDTTSSDANYSTTFVAANIQPAKTTPQWTSPATWDSSSSAIFVAPLSLVNQTDLPMTTYKRPPECMVEPENFLVLVPAVMAPDGVTVLVPAGTAVNSTSSFIVTARGFGPEVAAVPSGASRLRPLGSEVWMQSQISIAQR